MNEEISDLKAAWSNQKLAKFKKPFHMSDNEDVWLLVSLENERQSGPMLSAFFVMLARLNENKANIQKIKIIISDSLNRHYRGVEKAEAMGKNWLSINKENLENSSVVIELVSWDVLLSEKETKKRERQLRSFYEINEEFQTVVNNLASSHAKKASLEAAKNYIFEECAVISSLNGHLCYPSDDLNEALKISVSYFKSELIYHGYSIYDTNSKHKQKKERKNANGVISPPIVISKNINDDKVKEKILLCSAASLSLNLDLLGIHGARNQAGFFQQFLELKEKFSSSSDSEESVSNSVREKVVSDLLNSSSFDEIEVVKESLNGSGSKQIFDIPSPIEMRVK